MKKAGFTLMELLATLIILSILMMITIAGVNSYISKTNRTYYDNLEKAAKEAVMDFFSDNRNYFPKGVGEIREVNLQDLVDKKYLDQLVDADKKDCTGTAKVIKNGANQYDYKVCLKCPSKIESIGDGCS